jgi:hypothetical protein
MTFYILFFLEFQLESLFDRKIKRRNISGEKSSLSTRNAWTKEKLYQSKRTEK